MPLCSVVLEICLEGVSAGSTFSYDCEPKIVIIAIEVREIRLNSELLGNSLNGMTLPL